MEAVRARGMVWDQAEILSMSLSCQWARGGRTTVVIIVDGRMKNEGGSRC
jgi:hypothetical protein